MGDLSLPPPSWREYVRLSEGLLAGYADSRDNRGLPLGEDYVEEVNDLRTLIVHYSTPE